MIYVHHTMLAAALARMPRRGLWIVSRLDGDVVLIYWAALDALRDLYARAGVEIR